MLLGCTTAENLIPLSKAPVSHQSCTALTFGFPLPGPGIVLSETNRWARSCGRTIDHPRGHCGARLAPQRDWYQTTTFFTTFVSINHLRVAHFQALEILSLKDL